MRKGDWIQTHSGVQFFPLDPRPEDIHLTDIVHSLAQQVRYTGHAPEPYTIAQHSVAVSKRAADLVSLRGGSFIERQRAARWGLLHDATEAYLVDVPRPIKPHLVGYREIEDALMAVIVERFGLAKEEPPEIKMADNDVLVTEASFFFPEERRPAPWGVLGKITNPDDVWPVLGRRSAAEAFWERAALLGFVTKGCV